MNENFLVGGEHGINQRLILSNHSAAMLLENKALIYCILGSHNEVLMHYPG
jgi:hypothetical protein